MSLALDSSLTVAWYFPDEGTDTTDAVLRQVVAAGAVAPVHWRAEVANALQMLVRRKRIDAAYRDSSLSELARLPIAIDPETNQHVWDTAVQLAYLHRLTIYDAVYLELAQRRRLPLATLDKALRAAARACGIALLGIAP